MIGALQHLERVELHRSRQSHAAGDGDDAIEPVELAGARLEAEHRAEIVSGRIDRLTGREPGQDLGRAVTQALAADLDQPPAVRLERVAGVEISGTVSPDDFT